MSYYEAIQDGIPIEKDGKGFMWYYPPCSICGSPVPSWRYIRGAKYTCSECRRVLVEIEETRREESPAFKKEKRLDEALKRISKVAKISHYEKAIKSVRKGFSKPLYYQSTEEMMAALELLRRGVKTYHQVKVYDYRVDFVLPEYKTVLEIDGAIYHPKSGRQKEAIRDEVIDDAFGDGWEVIHISADCINTNVTRLLPGIKAVLKRRKEKECSRIQ